MKVKFERFKNVRIEESPLTKFPEMVVIAKTPAKLKELIGRKYINMTKAKLAVDKVQAENLIAGGMNKSKKELEQIGLGSEMNF